MPILTFTDSEICKGGVLNSRVLIGRRLSHGVVLSDPSVSRLHAWIDPVAGEQAGWVITDAGSKTGTFVNDQRVTRHPLHDGDKIRVGNVTLTYQDQDTLSEGVSPVELSAPGGVVESAGILFQCACGAPLWVGKDLAGKRGMCRHCRQPVTVPAVSAELRTAPAPQTVASPARVPGAGEQVHSPDAGSVFDPEAQTRREVRRRAGLPVEESGSSEYLPSGLSLRVEDRTGVVGKQPGGETVTKPVSGKRAAQCAVCHSAIVEGEEKTQCPHCAMNFHAECWQENFGCSSYGCPQVNVLQPTGTEAAEVQTDSGDAQATPSHRGMPWEPILLGASVVGSLLGALLFGSLAAIVAVFAAAILIKGKARRPALLIVAMIVCLIGIVAGLGVSDFWYFKAQHLPSALTRYIQ